MPRDKSGKKGQKPPEVRPTIPDAQRPMPARDLIRTAEKNFQLWLASSFHLPPHKREMDVVDAHDESNVLTGPSNSS